MNQLAAFRYIKENNFVIASYALFYPIYSL